jgi:hypothetical protein
MDLDTNSKTDGTQNGRLLAITCGIYLFPFVSNVIVRD